MTHQSGFTLTELLVVVAIIGILAAIAIPGFLGAQGRTLMKSAKEEAATLASAMEVYYQEHNDYGTTGTLTGVSSIQARFPAYRPSTDIQFTPSVQITNNGQAFTITITPTNRKFPNNLTSLQMNERNELTWVH